MFAEIEDAIIQRCKRVAGDHVRTIEDLPGNWNDKTLQAALRQVPGIYVAWGGGKARDASRPILMGRYVVYVVTGHASGQRERRRGNVRQVGAYELLELVIPALHDFTIPGIGSLALERVDNLYADRWDKQGVVIYAISLGLPMPFPAPLDVATLGDFAIYSGTHHIGDGPATKSHLELPTQKTSGTAREDSP